jgi:hypothetical protein
VVEFGGEARIGLGHHEIPADDELTAIVAIVAAGCGRREVEVPSERFIARRSEWISAIPAITGTDSDACMAMGESETTDRQISETDTRNRTGMAWMDRCAKQKHSDVHSSNRPRL